MFEEFCTVLCQIEVSLNIRPINPLSPDPNDLQALTPAHFLIGRPYAAVVDLDVQDLKMNTHSHYRYIQKLHQDFWKRWSREYIAQLGNVLGVDAIATTPENKKKGIQAGTLSCVGIAPRER